MTGRAQIAARSPPCSPARGTGAKVHAELTIAPALVICYAFDLGQAEAELRSPDGKGRAFVV